MKQNPVSKAIELSGGVKELARKLGVTYQAVRKWEKALANGQLTRLPAERAVEIEAAIDGRVSRSEMRPDLWPWPPS